MKAEKYRKEKEHAKLKGQKNQKDDKQCRKCEYLAENYLLEFQKA